MSAPGGLLDRAVDGYGALGTLERWTGLRDVVGTVAVDYRDELAAAVELLPAGTQRWHLEGLLRIVDRALEARAAFDAAVQR